MNNVCVIINKLFLIKLVFMRMNVCSLRLESIEFCITTNVKMVYLLAYLV